MFFHTLVEQKLQCTVEKIVPELVPTNFAIQSFHPGDQGDKKIQPDVVSVYFFPLLLLQSLKSFSNLSIRCWLYERPLVHGIRADRVSIVAN